MSKLKIAKHYGFIYSMPNSIRLNFPFDFVMILHVTYASSIHIPFGAFLK